MYRKAMIKCLQREPHVLFKISLLSLSLPLFHNHLPTLPKHSMYLFTFQGIFLKTTITKIHSQTEKFGWDQK